MSYKLNIMMSYGILYTVFLSSLSYQDVLRSGVYVISRNALNISYVAGFIATYFTLPTVSFSPQRQHGLFIQPLYTYLALSLKLVKPTTKLHKIMNL